MISEILASSVTLIYTTVLPVVVIFLMIMESMNRSTSSYKRRNLKGKTIILTGASSDLLEKSQSSRIVHVTTGFMTKYAGALKINQLNDFDNPLKTYCSSKLYLRLFNYELAKKLSGFGIGTFSVHPGDCYTNLFTDMPTSFRFFTRIWMFFQRSVKKASQTVLHFENFNPIYNDSLIETNKHLSEDLWNKSAEIVKLR